MKHTKSHTVDITKESPNKVKPRAWKTKEECLMCTQPLPTGNYAFTIIIENGVEHHFCMKYHDA